MSREQFWFFHPLRVRYSETDPQGVVHNANYLMYFDTTITEYFRALGYDQQADAKRTGVDFHVVKSLIEYKAPVRFDQEIDVGIASPVTATMDFLAADILDKCSRAVPARFHALRRTLMNGERPVFLTSPFPDR